MVIHAPLVRVKFRIVMFQAMNSLMKSCSRQHSKIMWSLKRHMSKKELIKEQMTAEDLPVFQYPLPQSGTKRVFAWGLQETGALGLRYKKKYRGKDRQDAGLHCHRPVRLTFAEKNEVYGLTCGFGFSAFAVKSRNHDKVFGCGINTDSQIGYHAPRIGSPLEILTSPAPIGIQFKHPKTTRILGLAGGRAHLVVLTDAEGLFFLGNNAYGQCARPIIEGENYIGSRLINNIKDLDGAKVFSVVCGQDHSLFITEHGKVYSCGWGGDGQTGQGHYENSSTPSAVKGDIENENIIKVASAMDCVLAVNNKGEVFGWGNAEYGQLPSEDCQQQINVAREIKFCRSLGRIVDIAAGGTFCMVLNDEGQVFVWGYGILGLGPKVEHRLEPTEIPTTLFGRNAFQPDSKVIGITCGMAHLLAWTNYGDLYAWGKNRSGCLGLGDTADQFFPFKVCTGADVISVHCGVDHTLALCKGSYK